MACAHPCECGAIYISSRGSRGVLGTTFVLKYIIVNRATGEERSDGGEEGGVFIPHFQKARAH